MAASATHSKGTKIKRGDGGSPEVFTAIGQITGISGLGSGTPKEIDITNLDSEGMEFLMGLPNEGSMSVSLNWASTDAQQAGLWADRAAKTLRNFQILFPDGTLFSFAALVTVFNLKAPINEKIDVDMTLRISGLVTKS